MLDRHLNIVWRNSKAEQELFLLSEENKRNSHKNSLFDWLCDSVYHNSVVNWRQWVRFFMQHAHGMISGDELNSIVDGLDSKRKPLLNEATEHHDVVFNRDVFSGRIRQVRANGTLTSFWVVATDFDQGRLFVFDCLHPDVTEPGLAMAAAIEQKLEVIRRNPQQCMKSSVHVLAVRLNNAKILRLEMLNDEYARLLSRLWQRTIETIENHGGIVSQDGDSGLVGYFLPSSPQDEPPLSVIECALRLKAQMAELGREWKIRKGWLHDLELNMGIHSDEESLGLIRSSVGDSLTLFGDSLKVASHLSQMGSGGQIWTTKAMINKLSAEDLKRLRFGVFRQDNQRQVFISRCFSRIRDLKDTTASPANMKEMDEIGSLAVTQVFDL
ncbi:MAG: hypothetical protein P8X55_02610 [Desulfosarcinaceae bacterium]